MDHMTMNVCMIMCCCRAWERDMGASLSQPMNHKRNSHMQLLGWFCSGYIDSWV